MLWCEPLQLQLFLNTLALFFNQALAELYVIDGQYEKAFSLYADVSFLMHICLQANLCSNAVITGIITLDLYLFKHIMCFICFALWQFLLLSLLIFLLLYFQLMKPYIFDFIEKHNLHDAIREKVWWCKIKPKWLIQILGSYEFCCF